jgi:TRAP-type C4-dicarboxylate transport system substrate-binding protein
MKRKQAFFAVVCTLLLVALMGGCTAESPSSEPAKTTQPSSAPEVITLKYSNPFQEMEPSVIVAYYFLDYVEEKSGGRVKFERFPGGVLGTVPEHLELVRSGSVDAVNLIVFNYREDLPLHQYPQMVFGSNEEAVAYHKALSQEIPETAAMLDQEFAENNIKAFSSNAFGENGIISKEVFNTMADLKGKKIGISSQQQGLIDLGIEVVSVEIPDMYESLSRGHVDALTMALGPMAILKWHEVSKCYRSLNEYGSGQPMCVNLETWNSLPEDIQQIFNDAAEATIGFSLELNAQGTAEVLQIFKDAGLDVGKLNDADAKDLFDRNYEYAKQETLEVCGKQGKTAEAETILKYCDELIWGK